MVKDELTLKQAADEYGLDERMVRRVYRRLWQDRAPFRKTLDAPIANLYRRADILAAMADATGQRREDQRARWRAQLGPGPTKPCGRCGRPIPLRWVLDRCHACMRTAA